MRITITTSAAFLFVLLLSLAAASNRLAQYPAVIAVTHVPPFKEAAWYNGRHSDDNYLPHFACKAVGDVMRRIMEANPQSRLTVLCGHTHGSGEVRVMENLQVLTGGAEYGNPVIQRIFDIG